MGSQAAFRAPIGIQLVFAVVVTIIVFGLPESPRWLAKRGREKEAIEVLCNVFDLPEDDPYIVGEIEAIRAAIAIEQHSGAQGASALFKKDILQTRTYNEEWNGELSKMIDPSEPSTTSTRSIGLETTLTFHHRQTSILGVVWTLHEPVVRGTYEMM